MSSRCARAGELLRRALAAAVAAAVAVASLAASVRAQNTETVELAPPPRTLVSGFDENAAKAGDAMTAIGNRSRDHAEKRMKAVQLVVNGKTYNIYPDRVTW